MTDTLRSIGLSELERVMGADKLSSPQPVRDRWGRFKRDPGGQWDWFYQLDESERQYLQRNHMGGAMSPDELATRLHCMIDECMLTWLTAKRRRRTTDPLDDDYETCEDDDVAQLVGPKEVATMLQVAPNTLNVWRNRGLLEQLPPFITISDMPIWRREDVLDWAKMTGRILA